MKKNVIPITLTTIILLFLLFDPKKYISCVLMGILMFGTTVFPALFPFMVLTSMLDKLGAANGLERLFYKPSRFLFKAPKGAAFVFAMSSISGSPVGAKLLSESFERGVFSEDECKKIMPYCSSVSPVFIIGTIGSIIFKNVKIGYAIFLAQFLASVFCGILFNLNSKPAIKTSFCNSKDEKNILSKSVLESILTLLTVGGIITMFYMVIDMLLASNLLFIFNVLFAKIFSLLGQNPALAESLLVGILEITRGILSLQSVSAPENVKILITTALVSFGGICINTQSFIFLKKCKIKAMEFLFAKIIHCLLSSLIIWFFLLAGLL